MRETNVQLYGLYPQQQKIYDDPTRFKVLNCGRRYGKTIMLIRALTEAMLLEGKPVAFYGFSDKTLDDTWNTIRDIMTFDIAEGVPNIIDKDERYKYLKIYNGGSIQFWSSTKTRNGRGKKYGLVVCDEVAFYEKPKELVTETILPTLADFNDSKLILASTPYGVGNYWHSLCTEPPNGFKTFTGTLYDNPFINNENIQFLKGATDPLIWQQEYLAMFVDMNAEKFFWNYKPYDPTGGAFHWSDYSYDLDPKAETWLVFDFNYNPCVATAYQMNKDGVYAMREFEANGGTRALCQRIKTSDMLDVPMNMWTITGDASGKNNSAVSGHVNNFDIIQEEFNLRDMQLKNFQSRNKSHEYSRVLCNEFLNRVPFIMDKSMVKTDRDLQKAKPDINGKLYKKRSEGYEMDHADTFRYFVDGRFPRGLEDINAYVAGLG